MARVEPRPGGARPRPGTDAFLRRLARFVLGLLFREVDLVGAERLPANGPAIVIANHTNSLVDGGILLGFLPRIPRFLAASTVWDYKPVAPFMNASGSVKVYRQQDGRAHEGSLEDSFAEAAALLAEGGVLAIFPEGRTHDDPALLPFKTGAARIAQFAEARHGPLDLAIVPVGIDYEAKNRFRSRACFTFAEPVRLGAGPAAGTEAVPGDNLAADRRHMAESPNVAVREATGRLQRALAAVAPDFPDRDMEARMRLAGEILAFDPENRAGHPPALSRIVHHRHKVVAAIEGADGAAEAAEVTAALDAYGRALSRAGLADHELAARPDRAALLRSALALVPGLPFAVIATVLCLPQALLLQSVARSKPRDRQMTWITFGGLVVYPLSWLAWAVVLGLALGALVSGGWGWAGAVAVFLLGPLSARLALPTIDGAARMSRALRARRRLRDTELARNLTAARARAEAALGALLAYRPG